MELLVGIIVAIITTLGTIANTIVTKHYSKKDDIRELKSIIADLKEESNKRDKEIERKFMDISMMYAKTYLIDLMSRIETGEEVNQEQVRLLYELKEVYNNAGGDSYVDDMFDNLKIKKLI